MTTLLIFLPLLFTLMIFLEPHRSRYRAIIALGLLQFVTAAWLYWFGRDPLPIIAPHFDQTTLSLGFLLAHTAFYLWRSSHCRARSARSGSSAALCFSPRRALPRLALNRTWCSC